MDPRVREDDEQVPGRPSRPNASFPRRRETIPGCVPQGGGHKMDPRVREDDEQVPGRPSRPNASFPRRRESTPGCVPQGGGHKRDLRGARMANKSPCVLAGVSERLSQ